jgi:Tfp pilus assembly PilM family ATPase
MAQPNIGLVIRAKQVELLSMQGKRVLASAVAPIAGEEPAHLTAAIQEALAAAGAKPKRVAVAVEHPDVLFRYFTLPNLPKAEQEGAIQFEARRYIPFKTEALVWDFKAAPAKDPSKMEVVFAAMPREVFGPIRDALAAVDVQPSSIEPRSISLARLMEPAPAKGAATNDFVCLVDIEQHSAHLAIVKHQLPYLTRDISLMRGTNLPAAGGEAPAAAEGEPLPPLAVFGDQAAEPAAAQAGADAAPDPRVERLMSELSVSMDFFLREYPSTTVSKVVLFGEQSLVAVWCQWLSGRLSYPVESGEALVAQQAQGPVDLASASAIGAALAARSKPGTSIDFLKRGTAQKPGAMAGAGMASMASVASELKTIGTPELIAAAKSPQMILAAAVAMGALLLLSLGEHAMVATVTHQFQQMTANRPKVNWGLDQMAAADLEPIKLQADTHLAFLKLMFEGRVSAAQKLDALARVLPEGMWVNRLALNSPMDDTGRVNLRLSLSGACLRPQGDELETIQKFEQQVKLDPNFFQGFTTAQLDQIGNEAGPQELTLRTFQLNLNSDRKL